jgi:aldose sugar dehydrogenase
MKTPLITLLACLTALTGSSCSFARDTFDTQEYKVRAVVIAKNLDHPWAIAFLPDGRMLVTERVGRLRIIENGVLIAAAVKGLPESVEHGQGGLMDVVLHPKFAENGWIYWTFNGRDGGKESGKDSGSFGTEVARGKLGGTREAPVMTNVEVLFKLMPKSSAGHHFGSRIVFDRQGQMIVTFGDRGDNADKGLMQRAQQLNDHAGKSIRLTDDGKVPADNPFVNTANAKPEIFTLGNRNMQGAAVHPTTGKIWAHEHGPQGGDEINILTAGTNYGWPVITFGANYGTGTKIGEGTVKEGMAQPLHMWKPSIAPSGMMFYSGKNFPKWKGNLFVGALANKSLVRLALEGDKVVKEERLFENKLGRIRDVREGPDGNLYIATDASDGEIVRLEPEKSL